MNINTKKLLAREFLILILCLSIGILYFLAVYPYNYFRQSQINSLTKEISEKKSLSYSLSKSIRQKTEKQYWYTYKYKSKFDIEEDAAKLRNEMWNYLEKLSKSDSLKIKWQNSLNKDLVAFDIELGFDTPEKFQSFIVDNIISQDDIEKNQKSIKVDSEINMLYKKIEDNSKKIIDVTNQLKGSYCAFFISAIIFFLLRYIFYGINWSIKTLKQS